jgi:hypothetical protein
MKKGSSLQITNERKIMEIDMSLNRSLAELCESYWEFRDSDEIRTAEEESEFGALEDCLEGMGFVSHLM